MRGLKISEEDWKREPKCFSLKGQSSEGVLDKSEKEIAFVCAVAYLSAPAFIVNLSGWIIIRFYVAL